MVSDYPACFAMSMQRYQMKALLAEQEKHNKNLFASLLTAMKPIMAGINKGDRLDRADEPALPGDRH